MCGEMCPRLRKYLCGIFGHTQTHRRTAHCGRNYSFIFLYKEGLIISRDTNAVNIEAANECSITKQAVLQ
jgi:hypothetical protein